ncbi:MAG: ergothioneine biosynthesis protein EgtB [Gemmatimonadaceae bacterium]
MTASAIQTTATKEGLSELLDEARRRTLLLISTVSEQDLLAQHDPLMGPIMWDLGHIAHFEELWLTRNLDGVVEFGEMPGMFNPFENPRKVRGSLALPTLESMLATMADIRERVLEKLETVDLDSSSQLLRDGYVYRMVVQHEYQHNETILQALQLKQGKFYSPPLRTTLPMPDLPAGVASMNRFPGGVAEMGTADRAAAYDNERPRHQVRLDPFWMDILPVRNAEFMEFMRAGGYENRAYWSEAGLEWLAESGASSPKYWFREGSDWITRSMDRVMPVDPQTPVCHVSYYEAEAFARFVGCRLPTEVEWEAAASWNPETGTKREYPWGDSPPQAGDANLDQLGFGAAPVRAYSNNRSPIGCYGMIGDVWEWTSSNFGAYPGYESFPYREYSEVFFGPDYKVLRGGSWATRPGAIRNTFRNWDFPIRRQIFSGFRCARDD